MDTELIMWIWMGIAAVDAVVGVHLLRAPFKGVLSDAEDTVAFFLTLCCGLALGGTVVMWLYAVAKYRPYGFLSKESSS